MKNVAVVLYMGLTGFGVVRSLAKQGVVVHGVDWNPNAIGFSSRHCREVHLFANPVECPDQFIAELVDLGKRLGRESVLFLAADYYVSIVSEFRDVLSEYFLFNVPTAPVVDVIADKRGQYRIASELGIPIPVTVPLISREDLRICQELFRFPVVVKGAVSHLWQSEFGDKAALVYGFDELKGMYELALKKGIGMLAQEWVAGPNRNHFKVCACYSRERKLLALFSTQKTRQYPVDFGVGTLMTSVNMPNLVETGQRLFNGLEYTGVGSIEFKMDERDGKFRLIELNPRFWQQSFQSTCAGVNFPYIYYLDCIGEKVEPELKFKENVRWVDLEQDFRSFLGNRKRAKISLLEWLKSVISAQCHAYFSLDDWKPFWEHWRFVLRNPLGRIARKLAKNKSRGLGGEAGKAYSE